MQGIEKHTRRFSGCVYVRIQRFFTTAFRIAQLISQFNRPEMSMVIRLKAIVTVARFAAGIPAS